MFLSNEALVLQHRITFNQASSSFMKEKMPHRFFAHKITSDS